MKSQKKIIIVTGSRAEYGLLSNLIKTLTKSSNFDCELAVTGSHLSKKFGNTINEITSDGVKVRFQLELDFTDDSYLLASENISKCINEFSSFFSKSNPDLLIILGDRYEIFGVAVSAFINRIPIAHIHGGELTFGALDDGFRHSITKFSQIHFSSTDTYKRRIIQMGESPENVYNVGSIGINNIENLTLLEKVDLEEALNFKFKENNFIVTFHPQTLNQDKNMSHLKEILNSLDNFKNTLIVFTLPNADPGNDNLRKLIKDFTTSREHCYSYNSLGHLKYLSLLKNVDCVIGNSSSGIIEAPFLGTPTVNIGNRQAGRELCESVISCEPNSSSITNSINKAISNTFKKRVNLFKTPYYRSRSIDRIIKILEERIDNLSVYKEFYDLDF